MLPYRYLSRRLHPVGRQLQNLPTGSRRLTARPSQYHYQPRDGKPEAQDKACRILHTVPTTRGQDGEGYMEYRYAYPQQSHKVCRGGRGQGNLQILPRTAYGKDKRRASSLSQGSDAILVSAIFCEMLGHLNKEVNPSEMTVDTKESIKQSDYILRKFIEMLSKDNGIHRSVGYYADALCYSPKHFSKVIKQACGRTPLDLINESAIEHIKYRLKHSDKSIKEIAEEFNFPNQSFFGKYVKSYLGMSPARYRNTKEE